MFVLDISNQQLTIMHAYTVHPIIECINWYKQVVTLICPYYTSTQQLHIIKLILQRQY